MYALLSKIGTNMVLEIQMMWEKSWKGYEELCSGHSTHLNGEDNTKDEEHNKHNNNYGYNNSNSPNIIAITGYNDSIVPVVTSAVIS